MKDKPILKRAPLRAYTKKELRKLYGISFHIWNKWVSKHELKLGKGYTLTVKEVEIIFEKLGVPGEIEAD